SGRFAEAEAAFQRALQLLEDADESVSAAKQVQPLRSSLQSLQALSLQEQGKHEEALKLLQDNLREQEEILGPGNSELASTLASLGRVSKTLGRYADAEGHFRRTLAIQDR